MSNVSGLATGNVNNPYTVDSAGIENTTVGADSPLLEVLPDSDLNIERPIDLSSESLNYLLGGFNRDNLSVLYYDMTKTAREGSIGQLALKIRSNLSQNAKKLEALKAERASIEGEDNDAQMGAEKSDKKSKKR